MAATDRTAPARKRPLPVVPAALPAPGEARVSERRDELYEARILAHAYDGAVLEVGCGPRAPAARMLAQRGVAVVAVDPQPFAAARARELVRSQGLEELVDVRLGALEALELPDGAIDLVCGWGALRHVDADRALAEVARVLRATGTAVLSEPLGRPVLALPRRGGPPRPAVMGADELLDTARRHFASVEGERVRGPALVAEPAPRGDVVRRALEGVERRLDSGVPTLRRWGWALHLELARPRSASAGG